MTKLIPEDDLEKRGTQDRSKRPSASISVSWETYDELLALARENGTSIGRVVKALVDEYYKQQE